MRAYDPTLGRFLSRDPLGRVPLFFDANQPYAYGGNNPLTNVDPSGQMFRGAFGGELAAPRQVYHPKQVRISPEPGRPIGQRKVGCDQNCRIGKAKYIANDTAHRFAKYQIILFTVAIPVDIMGLLVTAIGAILEFIPLPVAKAIGAAVAAIGILADLIGVALSGLAAEAWYLNSEFSWNSSWNSLDRWTRSNLEAMRRSIQRWMDFGTKVYAGLVGLGKAIAGINPNQLWWIPNAFNSLRLLVGLVPIVLGLAGVVATMHFNSIAMDAINREENVLGV